MNLDHDFVQVSKLSEEPPKKGLHQKWNTFFPRIQVDTYAQMYTRVKLLGGGADVDHTQIIGGYSQIIGRIYPPHPPGFRHL